MPDGPWPGTGAVLAAIETATGRRRAHVVGKPEPTMYEAARDRLGAGRVLAVGDRLDVDVAGARRAGLDSALVLTGGTTRAEADAAEPPTPTHVADSARPRCVPAAGVAGCAQPAPSLASSPRGRPRLPDRQPARRRRPRAAAAARREAALRGHGRRVPGRADDVDGARARAGAATPRDAGEIVGRDGRRRARPARSRASCATATGVLAVLPGGRGNDFARKLGIPHDPVAACELLVDGDERRIDLAEAAERTYLGILSAGFDSDVNRIANETRLPLGTLVYVYGAAAGDRALAARRAGSSPSTARRASSPATRSPWPTRGVFGGGMFLAPDASLEDGMLDVVMIAAQSKLRYLRGLPRVFKGTHLRTRR